MNDFDNQDIPVPNATEDRTARIVAALLRIVLMVSAALAIAWPLSPSSGCMAAGLGAALGIVFGEWSGRSRLRMWLFLAIPPVSMVSLYLWTQGWVYWDWPSQALGWSTALDAVEIMRWGGGTFLVVATLRAYGRRYSPINAIELLLPIVAAASLFSAHREGQIHRPQQLADRAIEFGQDPTWYLILIGICGALFLTIGLLRLRRVSQLLGGLALIMLLFAVTLWGASTLPYHSIAKSIRQWFGQGNKKPKKRQKPSKARQVKGKPQQGRRNKNNNDPMPFQPRQKQKQKKQRQRPVAMVVFKDDYKPTSKVYYFRQQVLSQFNGVRMTESHNHDFDRDRAQFFPTADGTVKIPRSIEWHQRPKQQLPLLYKLPKKKATKHKTAKDRTKSFVKFFYGKKKKKKTDAFSVVTTQVSLLQRHQKPFALVSPRTLRALVNPNQRLFLRSYEVVSKTWNGKWDLKIDFGETYWPKEVWKHYTQTPKDPRYEALRKKILQSIEKSPYKDHKMVKAYVLKTWLEKEAAYSMRIKIPPNVRDHTAHFLFKTKVGYCVHFSHAAVYLFRLSGIPARIAEGYAAQERHRGGSSALLLRSAEAHAWPEVYVKGVGWVPFDIHPRRSLDRTGRPPDPDLRRLYSNLARPQKKIKGKDSPYMAASRTFPWGPMLKKTILRTLYVAVACLLFLFVFAFSFKWLRRFAPYVTRAGPKRAIRHYRSLSDQLSELGELREPGESLEGFAYRLRDKLPDFLVITEQIVATSLGSKLAAIEDEKVIVRRIHQQLRAAYPWYKRWLQIIRPFAWFRHISQRWQFHPPPALVKWRIFIDKTGAFLRRTLPIFRRSEA